MITAKQTTALISAVNTHLSTPQKRLAFYTSNYNPTYEEMMEIPSETAIEYINFFKEKNMVGSLIADINSHFETDLEI